MSEKDLKDKDLSDSVDEEKRDFLFITTAGLAVAGGAVTAFSLIDTNNFSLIGNPLFTQSVNYNNYLGDKVRSYPNVEECVIKDL